MAAVGRLMHVSIAFSEMPFASPFFLQLSAAPEAAEITTVSEFDE